MSPGQRTFLSKRLQEGLVVFRLDDRDLRLIDGCLYPGQYAYASVGYKGFGRGSQEATSVGATALRFASAGVEYEDDTAADAAIVGLYESPLSSPNVDDLIVRDSCEGATHVASAIMVGAFAAGDSTRVQGQGGVGVESVATASASHERAAQTFDQGGKLADCEHARDDDESPPGLCNEPLHVKLVPLQKPEKLEYYFNSEVTAARTRDAALTADDMVEFAEAFEDTLAGRAKAENLEIVKVPGPSEDAFECGVGASTRPNEYVIQCERPGRSTVQEVADRGALESLNPAVARSLLAANDPTTLASSRAVPGRVVVLVDMSLSMLINDETTFTTDEIRRSKRYELVMLMLRGMQDHGLSPEVAVVTFSGAECMRPTAFDGEQLWTLTDDSRDAALEQLRGFLRRMPKSCEDAAGTDLVGPMQLAGQLLSAPKPSSKRDVVVLITDGAHQAQSHGVSPQAAAAALRKADIDLAVIRVQLNDLTDLRTRLNGADQPAILGRWATFVDSRDWVERAWTYKEKRRRKGEPPARDNSWLTAFPRENDGGTELLADLGSVELSKVFLSSNDSRAEPLLIAHELLLPLLGVIEPVFSAQDILPGEHEGPDGRPVVQAIYEPRIVRGRPFMVRIKKPECMGSIVAAQLTAALQEPVYLEVLWEDGAIVTFAPIKIDRFPDDKDGRTTSNKVKLIVAGEPVQSVQTCQR